MSTSNGTGPTSSGTSWRRHSSGPTYALSYHDSCLYDGDIALLRGPLWLNDTLIGFWLELLEHETYAAHRERFLYVGPDTVQLIKLDESRTLAAEVLGQLEAGGKEFVFFPLNNNEDASSAGGTHWSLLIFSRPDRRFYGLDSAGTGCSRQLQQRFSHRVAGALLAPGERLVETEVAMIACKRQSNGHDCGVHVLWMCNYLTHYALKNGCLDGLLQPKRVQVGEFELIDTYRQEMLRKIKKMIRRERDKAK